MRTVKKQLDMNAHIEDLRCEVHVENGNAVARVSFVNLGYGDITAIKFNACGYNSFGDVVFINEKEKFFLIIQDTTIAKNQTANDLKAKLPNADIRKLDLEECQICYADGSIVTYEGKQTFDFEIEEFDSNADKEQLNALQKLYDKHIRYKIKDFEEGWICGCGRFNRHEKSTCTLCGKRKADTVNACSTEGLEQLVEKLHITEKQEREAAEERERQRAKREKKKRLGIVAGIVCAVVLLVLGINSSVLSKREIYSSEDEMRNAMQGTWSYYGYSDEVLWQIQIDGDTCAQVFDATDDAFEREITWKPSRGTFEVGSKTYVVNKGGRTLKEGSYEYLKGGTFSSNDDSTSSYSYESGYTALKITDLEWDNNSSYNVCTGKVKNTGDKTYYYVKVKGSFEDASGNVLDTDWTYAVGSEGLASGESTSFRLSVDKDQHITDCTVSILDYDN